ncbi:MAG TPA: hypothetical protein QGI03_16060 [Dehalococcoidia bacterium]|nr:hypothetical protein [Dehalococcoidia bacterium]
MLKQQGSQPTGLKVGIHYAWIVIAIAAFMHTAGGSIRQAFGVLIVPFQENMGWGPGSVTLSYSMASIIGATLAPISGMATDRRQGEGPEHHQAKTAPRTLREFSQALPHT